jgi:succinate dehydrogenase / fumarate reductase, cytochrome b subunit
MSGFFRSTIGYKVVMAVSGLILFGFVIGHMIGNLTVYLGPHAMNAYAEFLREFLHGGGLWVARAVLLVAVVAHIKSAWSLARINAAARPIAYQKTSPRESTYASRTMRWSGVLVLAFIIYHLLHLTIGSAHPDFIPGDAYHNVVVGLQQAPAAIFYIIAMIALGMHLFHGASSMLQTLGLNHARYNRLRNVLSAGLAMVVVVGNLSFPATILAGLVS